MKRMKRSKDPDLEVLEEVLADSLVESPAADITGRAAEHGQLALVEAAGRRLGAGVTDVHEHNVPGERDSRRSGSGSGQPT